ncbi:MarR family winged helix-turn-helix transcriptional regulator [Rathayibacter iranicus]|uniref:MarR family transcriptional regulator n=2 Tax=Rathayibacter iranicus TaxID=59737 RepID=A0AAD1ENU9_9MICO|nr:MarR family transcriptional regulator [Rathayibacter iranicus]AZZ56894.1 MarR family transcriptional regulator [Rathayibacter iranicus]MWV29493.1 MarR family transcriptional regulator [Rathayibacter iranicus NCPPB 2253 = VKM Ac-1602]PPI42407.1 MarR family transcriptional regulator [Rathayibacter iranicus]PPI57829.1 MarR family transcriptional regulator [Rathayibacter iranicus]PPI68767.1 MarR family transcriptional regulator [Rathayibacter iranicus]
MTPEKPTRHERDDDAPAVQLRHALRLLENAQQHLRASTATAVGVGISELTALEVLGESPDLTPKWLGLELSLSTGAVTALLDRLATAGYVDRVANPHDRRSVLLRLTDSGTLLLAQVDERYDEVSAQVLEASPSLGGVAEDLARAAAVIIAHTIH